MIIFFFFVGSKKEKSKHFKMNWFTKRFIFFQLFICLFSRVSCFLLSSENI